MARMMSDCRRFESDSKCTLTIIGDEDEVVLAAAQHAVAVHGHQDTPALKDGIRRTLEPAEAYTPGERTPEPFPA